MPKYQKFTKLSCHLYICPYLSYTHQIKYTLACADLNPESALLRQRRLYNELWKGTQTTSLPQPSYPKAFKAFNPGLSSQQKGTNTDESYNLKYNLRYWI